MVLQNPPIIYTHPVFYYILWLVQFPRSHKFKIYECILFRVGHAVAQLVEALLYKSEGREFDSR